MQPKQLRCLCAAMVILCAQTLFAQVPTPKSHFGFSIGDNYQLANFTQTESYFRKIAAASDRVKFVEMGKTEEGRVHPMLIISSPQNLANLEKYRTISTKLAHAENLSEAEARQLAEEGKAVVWIDGGLHSTEMVATHQLIETAYQLTSRTDAETMRILDNVIILLAHANPDGQELVANWYMRTEDSTKRSMFQLPRLYEKYAGHDNNRDFFMLNLKETQNIGRQLFVEWIPQIMYNHHQSGPPGSVVAGAPYRDPFNYVFDPLLMTSLDAVGAAMNNRLNVEGKPGYTQRTGSSFSTWYNGGLRTTTYFHNMVGLLTEIIGNPAPSEVPLVPQRLIPSGATPNPVTPQKWYFRQSIDYSISLNYAVLNYAVRYRDELLFNIYRMGMNSIERGSQDYWTLSPGKIEAINEVFQRNNKNASASFSGRGPSMPPEYFDSVMRNPATRDARAYVISKEQKDFPTATKFINALIKTGILVHKATGAFTVNGKKYPAGSFIVKTNQAFRPHILDMFEPQDHPNDFQYPGGPPIPPYDAAGWTLAYMMGVQFDRFTEDVQGPFERIPFGETQQPEGLVSGNGNGGYSFPVASNNSFIVVNDLLAANVPVFRDGASFYVPAGGKAKETVTQSAKEHGVTVQTSSKKSGLTPVKQSKIAVWDSYGGSMPSGWMRYIMEQFHFPYELVYAPGIDAGNLRSKYDVIIFVGGAIPSAGGSGFRGRNSDSSDIPKEFHSMIGRISPEKSIPALKAFLEQGGNIVTIGSSTNLAHHLELPVSNALVEISSTGEATRLPRDKYFIPGSVLSMEIDTTAASMVGLPRELDVYFDESPVFSVTPQALANGSIRPLAWFSKERPLRSGWALGQSYLKNGITAFSAPVGKGVLYAFGPEITFRAQTHGSFRLLFNQLYR